MTLGRVLTVVRWGDVNGLFPVVVIAVAVGVAASGRGYIGAGIAVGALLALMNSSLLLRRIAGAVETGNPAAAMISMQVGLLVTFTVVAAVTVLLVLVSRSMAVAMGISFFVTQTGQIAVFFLERHGQSRPGPLSPANREGM